MSQITQKQIPNAYTQHPRSVGPSSSLKAVTGYSYFDMPKNWLVPKLHGDLTWDLYPARQGISQFQPWRKRFSGYVLD
jgi:hypothetical protein